MVRAGCVFVAGIHPSRTWTSGSFESVRCNACMHRLDLGLYSHPKEFLGEWSLNPCQLQGKNPLYRKISPEEDRTRDAVDSEPKHYQRAVPAPGVGLKRGLRLFCKLGMTCTWTRNAEKTSGHDREFPVIARSDVKLCRSATTVKTNERWGGWLSNLFRVDEDPLLRVLIYKTNQNLAKSVMFLVLFHFLG